VLYGSFASGAHADRLDTEEPDLLEHGHGVENEQNPRGHLPRVSVADLPANDHFAASTRSPSRWDESARDHEKRLLAHLGDLHSGRRPFANLTG